MMPVVQYCLTLPFRAPSSGCYPAITQEALGPALRNLFNEAGINTTQISNGFLLAIELSTQLFQSGLVAPVTLDYSTICGWSADVILKTQAETDQLINSLGLNSGDKVNVTWTLNGSRVMASHQWYC